MITKGGHDRRTKLMALAAVHAGVSTQRAGEFAGVSYRSVNRWLKAEPGLCYEAATIAFLAKEAAAERRISG